MIYIGIQRHALTHAHARGALYVDPYVPYTYIFNVATINVSPYVGVHTVSFALGV